MALRGGIALRTSGLTSLHVSIRFHESLECDEHRVPAFNFGELPDEQERLSFAGVQIPQLYVRVGDYRIGYDRLDVWMQIVVRDGALQCAHGRGNDRADLP